MSKHKSRARSIRILIDRSTRSIQMKNVSFNFLLANWYHTWSRFLFNWGALLCVFCSSYAYYTCNSNNKLKAWPCHLDDITINWSLPSTFKKSIAQMKIKKSMIEREEKKPAPRLNLWLFFASLGANQLIFCNSSILFNQ